MDMDMQKPGRPASLGMGIYVIVILFIAIAVVAGYFFMTRPGQVPGQPTANQELTGQQVK
jgi:hypothetical protein